jgi:hypothetical protein
MTQSPAAPASTSPASEGAVAVGAGLAVGEVFLGHVLRIEALARDDPALASRAGNERVAGLIAVRAFETHQFAGGRRELDSDGFIFHDAGRRGVGAEIELGEYGHGGSLEEIAGSRS